MNQGDGAYQDSASRCDSTSRSLLAEAKDAQPAAWERLVRLYAPLVASWCRRWSVAEQDIADVLQDVFASLARSLNRFRKEQPSDTFRGWLRTIARNKVQDHFRRQSAEPHGGGGTEAAKRLQAIPDSTYPSETADAASDDDSSIDELFDYVVRPAIELIRGEFHERSWQAFWGVVVEGRATVDVAADLHMTPGAVRVAKSRILLRLRNVIGDLPQS